MKMRKQNMPFMFEVWSLNGIDPLSTYVFPFGPESYKKTEAPRTTITHTHGGTHEDRGGMAPPKITLSGSFGFAGTALINGKKASRATAVGMGELDGWGFYKELEALILDFYGAHSKVTPTLKDRHRVHFYAFTDQTYLEVSIDRFDIQRSTSKQFQYTYVIEMTGLRRLDIESRTEYMDESGSPVIPKVDLPSDDKLSFFSKLLATYAAVNGAMDTVLNEFDAYASAIKTISGSLNAFIQRITDLIEAPFGLVTTAIESAQSVMDSIEGLADIPHELKDMIRQSQRDLLTLAGSKDKFQSAETYAASTAEATVIATAEEIAAKEASPEILTGSAPGQAATSAVAGMENPETTLLSQTIEKVTSSATTDITIYESDDLESIAVRVFGDGNRWRDLALINDLDAPFIVDAASIEAFSSDLAEGMVAYPANADDNSIQLTMLSGFPVETGQVLVVEVDGVLLWRTVLDVYPGANGDVADLSTPIDRSVPLGARVTLHEQRFNVLLHGEKIKIPIEANATSGSSYSIDGTAEERLFRCDEYIGDDLQSSGSGAIENRSGITNLQQQLERRVNTKRGELGVLGHPFYGSNLSDMIGKAGVDVWFERCVLEVKMTLLGDPRIKSVKKIEAVFEGGLLLCNAEILPIDQDTSQNVSLMVN
jgi:hypothetical protein